MSLRTLPGEFTITTIDSRQQHWATKTGQSWTPIYTASVSQVGQRTRAVPVSSGTGQLGPPMGVSQGHWQPSFQEVYLRSACISQIYTTEVKFSTILPSTGNNTTKAPGMGGSPDEAPRQGICGVPIARNPGRFPHWV